MPLKQSGAFMRSIGIILIGGMLAFGAATSFYGEDIVGLNMGSGTSSASGSTSGSNQKFAEIYRKDGARFHSIVQAALHTCLKVSDPKSLMTTTMKNLMASSYRYAALSATAKDDAEERKWAHEMNLVNRKAANIKLPKSILDEITPLATDAGLRNCVTVTAVSKYQDKKS